MCATQKEHKQPRIYIAAALFSPSERRLNEELCSLLEACYSTYLPQRDGTLIESVARNSNQIITASLCKQVYEQDIEAIAKSDILFAVLDGRSLDEGVCIEMGYAKALGKLIVGYKSDVRKPLPWGDNPMVRGCVDVWISSFDELSNWMVEFSTTAALTGGIAHENARKE